MPTPPQIPDEPRLRHRSPENAEDPHDPHRVAAALPPAAPYPAALHSKTPRTRVAKLLSLLCLVLLVLAAAGWLFAGWRIRSYARAALPQLDGTQRLPGLAAPVTVARDAHGVPTLHAHTLDDLLFAQGFVTASDRLFQMDMLRRHAAGELAEVYGTSLLPHDKLQRTLQIRAAADRGLAALPADQMHMLTIYAQGVNAGIARQSAHLPLEFHLLGYQPAPWTPRDSLLVALAMFQDLTDTYAGKLARETLTTSLPASLTQAQRDALTADLYPVGSWRDHPPANPIPDLTIQGPPIEQVPLDESQAHLHLPTVLPSPSKNLPGNADPTLTPGSNNWAISGAHTASGKPLLSNDMHLTHTLPGIWYESVLSADEADLQVAGVTIPGLPLIVVGHTGHIAWGFTNLGADVQDVYIETLRRQSSSSPDAQEFQAADGTWQPVLHLPELIKVKHALNVTLDVTATRHGGIVTPILTPTLAHETRTLALRWTLYDPAVLQLPTLEIAQAQDWPSFLAAFAKFGGPAQNVIYADDQGHIGYHAAGRIPLRGPAAQPANSAAAGLPADIASPVNQTSQTTTAPIQQNADNPLAGTDLQNPAAHTQPLLSGPLSPVPLVPSAAHEWSGYIPFNQLPQVFDPPSGIVATANARVTPDDYPYPVALNWAAPYRVERIVHALAHRTGLKPEDMLAIQTDVYSDFDHVLAERLAYSLDRSLASGSTLNTKTYSGSRQRSLHQAADLLRTWNGRMSLDSPAAAIVYAVHAALWPMLLEPLHATQTPGASAPAGNPGPGGIIGLNALYTWGERDYALEQILAHNPPRWLPPAYTNWDDFLTAAVDRTLTEARAPSDLSQWHFGSASSVSGDGRRGDPHTIDIEHPLFAQSTLLRRLLGHPTGTGNQPQSGDATTVKQVGHTFGPSERFTADLANLQHSTLNLVTGQSGNPLSPWFLDQFPLWLRGTTLPQHAPATHTLTLTP